jgi:hypothetical protein
LRGTQLIKLLSFISIICTGIFTACVVIGLTLSDTTEIAESITIEAPKTVVWTALASNIDEHKWLQSIDALYNYNASARQVRYLIEDKTILVNQQVRIRENASTIDYFQIGKEKYTELQDFSGQILVTSLADGSSEVQWKIRYSTETLSERLINRFSIVSKIRSLLKVNLRSFKNYIER